MERRRPRVRGSIREYTRECPCEPFRPAVLSAPPIDERRAVADQPDTLVVLSTLPSDGEARALVRRLVDDRIVACGTVLGPITSVYRWEGRVEEATETQVLLKTRRDRWPALLAAVEALHPYDVPELLAVPVAMGLPAYVDWVRNETAEEDK